MDAWKGSSVDDGKKLGGVINFENLQVHVGISQRKTGAIGDHREKLLTA